MPGVAAAEKFGILTPNCAVPVCWVFIATKADGVGVTPVVGAAGAVPPYICCADITGAVEPPYICVGVIAGVVDVPYICVAVRFEAAGAPVASAAEVNVLSMPPYGVVIMDAELALAMSNCDPLTLVLIAVPDGIINEAAPLLASMLLVGLYVPNEKLPYGFKAPVDVMALSARYGAAPAVPPITLVNRLLTGGLAGVMF